MARTWTSRNIAAKNVIKGDDLNVELADAARVVNGGMDQHNLPLGSVTAAKLVDPTVESGSYTLSTYLAANSYHRSVLAAVDKTTPRITIDPEVEDLANGWHPLYLRQAGFTEAGTVLEFTGREGMIHGQCMVDFQRRISQVTRTDPPAAPTHILTHEVTWFRLGVFCNDVLVMDSGKIFPARRTLDLPFSFPAPAGPVRIETRFRASTEFQVANGAESPPGSGVFWTYVGLQEQYPEIKVFGTYLFARNQYR